MAWLTRAVSVLKQLEPSHCSHMNSTDRRHIDSSVLGAHSLVWALILYWQTRLPLLSAYTRSWSTSLSSSYVIAGSDSPSFARLCTFTVVLTSMEKRGSLKMECVPEMASHFRAADYWVGWWLFIRRIVIVSGFNMVINARGCVNIHYTNPYSTNPSEVHSK